MLTTLLLRNLGQRASPGGGTAGTPVVSVGTPVATTGGGGGGVRHFGAGYDYDDPVVVAVREEIKILQVEKQNLAKVDTSMLDAINERLAYLRKLLKDRDRMFLEAEQDYNYQARMKMQKRIEKRNKRARRLRAIARLLH